MATATKYMVDKKTGKKTPTASKVVKTKPITKAEFNAGAKAGTTTGAMKIAKGASGGTVKRATAGAGSLKSKVGNATMGTAKPIGRATASMPTKTPLHSSHAGNKLKEYYRMRNK